MLKIDNLNKSYGDKVVLKNVSLEIKEHDIVCLMGKSGMGKTTLLRTIAGLMKPLSGQVIVDGQVVTKANKNNVYMMHQNYTSFDWLDCLRNVLIAKEIKGKINENDVTNAIHMLHLVGLSEHKHKYPKQLSGGQRQRLALARTLFMNPEVVLMDEPLSALDTNTRKKMQDLIIKQHKEIKNTIIMVTHSREEAERMCDVIIEL